MSGKSRNFAGCCEAQAANLVSRNAREVALAPLMVACADFCSFCVRGESEMDRDKRGVRFGVSIFGVVL